MKLYTAFYSTKDYNNIMANPCWPCRPDDEANAAPVFNVLFHGHTHHGQLSLQFFDAVLLHVHLGS